MLPNKNNRQKHHGKEPMEAQSYQKKKPINGYWKSSYINNNHKYKWTEFTSKRHRVAGVKKQNPTICCLQEMHLNCKDKGTLRVKVWKMIVQANSIHRKACVAILISDKTDFKITKVTRDKDGHFIMIKDTT